MRSFKIILLIITFTINMNAQDDNYKGPASNQVKAFWLVVKNSPDGKSSQSQIKDMEFYLNKTKIKDPAFNTSNMETALQNAKGILKEQKLAEVKQFNGDKTKEPAEEKISDDPTVLLEKLFIDNNISVGSTGDLPKAPAKIDAYKAKTEKLLAMDHSDALIKKGRLAKGNINGFVKNTDRELEKTDSYLKDATEKSNMEYFYYTIQYHLAYWNAAQKVFKEETAYADMYKKVNATASKIGSLEQMEAKAKVNNSEYIKNTKLPAAVVKDAKLEKILIDGFNKKYSEQFKVSALKVVLTQDGWTTLRNSLTSVITGRERSAMIAYTGNDGKCYMIIDYVFIHEEYIGNSFTNTKAIFNGLDGKEMLCENVK